MNRKTLREREDELVALIATPGGRAELDALADRYAQAEGRLRPAGSSAVTIILVHERVKGLIRP